MTLDARLLEAGSAALPWVWCGLTLSIGLWEISAPLRTLRSPHLPRWAANLVHRVHHSAVAADA